MKFPLLLCFGSMLLLAQPVVAQSSTAELMREGQKAYAAGHQDIARARFEEVLARDSKNATARNYLRMISAAEAKGGGAGGKRLEARMKSVILPEVNLRDASLEPSLELLRQLAEKQTGEKVSFVLEPGAASESRATLSLTQIPFTEAVRYLAQLHRLEVKYDTYAIRLSRPQH